MEIYLNESMSFGKLTKKTRQCMKVFAKLCSHSEKTRVFKVPNDVYLEMLKKAREIAKARHGDLSRMYYKGYEIQSY